ncbi:expressed protein, partial [Phakopsora pachyrhizi]
LKMIRILSYMILLLVLLEALSIVPVIAPPHKKKQKSCLPKGEGDKHHSNETEKKKNKNCLSEDDDDYKDHGKKLKNKNPNGYIASIGRKYRGHFTFPDRQPFDLGIIPRIPETPF